MYPCTADERSWSDDVSMKSLFGKYCSGNIFAHDSQMRELARERDFSQSRKRRRESAGMPEESERRGSRNGSSSESETQNLEPLFCAPNGKGCVKTSRVSDRTSIRIGYRKETASTGAIPANTAPPSTSSFHEDPLLTRLRPIRKGLLRQVVEASKHNRSDQSMTAPTSPLRYQMRWDDVLPVHGKEYEKHPRGRMNVGTRDSPIELSDEEITSKTLSLSQETMETQITLSDSAFESQLSERAQTLETRRKIRRRKEAYLTVKESSLPEQRAMGESRLISTGGNHIGEESEL